MNSIHHFFAEIFFVLRFSNNTNVIASDVVTNCRFLISAVIDDGEKIVVACGRSQGCASKQLSFPWGLFVDHVDKFYVTCYYNGAL